MKFSQCNQPVWWNTVDSLSIKISQEHTYGSNLCRQPVDIFRRKYLFHFIHIHVRILPRTRMSGGIFTIRQYSIFLNVQSFTSIFILKMIHYC